MLPTLLYMKKLANKIAKEKILTSWLESSSNAPNPSVSRTRTLICSPSGVVPSIGLPQIQTPYKFKLTTDEKKNGSSAKTIVKDR